jgi:hypothetical protein
MKRMEQKTEDVVAQTKTFLTQGLGALLQDVQAVASQLDILLEKQSIDMQAVSERAGLVEYKLRYAQTQALAVALLESQESGMGKSSGEGKRDMGPAVEDVPIEQVLPRELL